MPRSRLRALWFKPARARSSRADGGPLAGELGSFGAEWLPMIAGSFNPFRIRANARTIAHLIAAERVDIVHAQHAAAAWSALRARARQFAEFMFSPQSVAEAIRGVYTSLPSGED